MQIPHRIGSFLLLAFGSSWATAGLGALLGVNAASGTSYTIMAGLCMLGPAFAAIVQHRFIDKACWHQLELSPNHIRWRWLAQTAVIGLCIFPLCLLVLYVFGDVLGVTAFGHVAVTGERFSTFVTNLLDQLGNTISHYRSTQRCAAIFPVGGMKHSQDDPRRSLRSRSYGTTSSEK